jgi:replicative superfamily II helicase
LASDNQVLASMDASAAGEAGGKRKRAAEAQMFVPVPPNSMRQRPITDVTPCLQASFHEVFSPVFSHFNAMQSQLVDKIIKNEDSLVLSAPTGTGKTVVFEMAVLALFKASEGRRERSGHKAVYLAPSKFLVMQKFQEWERKFSGEAGLGLRLVEVTGERLDVLFVCYL